MAAILSHTWPLIEARQKGGKAPFRLGCYLLLLQAYYSTANTAAELGTPQQMLTTEHCKVSLLRNHL